MGEITVILNGKLAPAEALEQAVAALSARGATVTLEITRGPEEAPLLARAAAARGAACVLAAGGDGTVNGVASGLLSLPPEARPRFGIVPLGTANDFAVACGLSDRPEKALALALEESASPIDVGRLDSGERVPRVFLNMATAGVGAEVTRDTPEALKRLLGPFAYLVAGLSGFEDLRPRAATFEGPDFSWSGEYLAFALGNGRQAGGGIALFPAARLDDGLLELAILPPPPAAEIPGLLASLPVEGFQALEPLLLRRSLTQLRVEAPEQLAVNLDGEPVEGRAFLFTLEPAALELHLPRGCPLLKASPPVT